MRCSWFLAVTVALSWWVLPARGQAKPDEAESLRQQIRALEDKLTNLEKSSLEKRRVTQIGSSRAKREEEEPRMVVRVYDVSDLFSVAPPYPAARLTDFAGSASPLPLFPSAESPWSGGAYGGLTGAGGMGGMGGMGGGFFSVPGETGAESGPKGASVPHIPSPPVAFSSGPGAHRIDFDSLIEAITTTIAPTEWDEVGGPGSITPLGTSLLVSTTEQNHEQIGALFDVLRERWRSLRTISVEAHWLWLSEAQLAALLDDSGKAAEKAGDPKAFGLVDEKEWQRLLEELQRPADSQRAGYRAVLTCYNGQTVHCVSGGQSPVVTGMIPVVDGAGGSSEFAVGYQPQVSTIHEGAALQITPMATTGGKIVTLDVHSRLVRREKAPPAKGPTMLLTGPQAVVAALDRPQLVCHLLETTVRIPVGRRMLVGGMTYEIQPDPGDPNLHLFVKVALQELRDDQPADKAGVPAPIKKGPILAPPPKR